MKLREFRQFGEGCTANKWSSWDLHPCFPPKSVLLTRMLKFGGGYKYLLQVPPFIQGREENGNSEGNPRGLCKEMTLEAVEVKVETFTRNEKLTLRHRGKQLYAEQWV